MSAWRVRPATVADATRIEAIHAEAWPDSGMHLAADVAESPDWFRVLDSTGPALAFLEFVQWGNWRLVGGLEEFDPDRNDALFLRLLAVSRALRGSGLGSRLLGEWIERLPAHFDYVFVDAAPVDGDDAVPALRRFHARHGFQLLPLGKDHTGMAPYVMGWSRPDVPLPEAPQVA